MGIIAVKSKAELDLVGGSNSNLIIIPSWFIDFPNCELMTAISPLLPPPLTLAWLLAVGGGRTY